MEKLDMKSMNKINENIKKIGTLFPNCVTERKNAASASASSGDAAQR